MALSRREFARTAVVSAAAVSFESVDRPGYFLRHYSYAIRLEQNDNTAIFRADATFYRTAGLADGAWSSFRSYNFPDRYLRHAGQRAAHRPARRRFERERPARRHLPGHPVVPPPRESHDDQA